MFASIALNIPADKLFTYSLPENLASDACVGKRVFVPFGSRRRTGFIVALSSSCELADVRPVIEILDEEPLFDEHDLHFYKWIANYCIYPLGKTLGELIPSGSEKKDFIWVTALPMPPDAYPSRSQKKILEIIKQTPEGISLNDLIRQSGLKTAAAVVRGMRMAGLIDLSAKEKKQLAVRTQKIVRLNEGLMNSVKLTQRQQAAIDSLKREGPLELRELMKLSGTSADIMKRLLEKGIIEATQEEFIRKADLKSALRTQQNNFELNDEQSRALASICRFADSGSFQPVLLHGVTGSGKTEVYLSAVDHVLKTGGTAIYLVPEIALTPQLISRITGRFDENKIAVVHSGISGSIRYDQWREIRRGRINLVIGARSALFSPVKNLKLIIVDEEHDSSYKQDERLCYHARDLAVVKAKFASAVCVLGSATPGLRTFYNAQTNKYTCLRLTGRANEKPLPAIEIVDMKAEKEIKGKIPVLSKALIAAVSETLAHKQQVLLFLNKRGFDTFLVCADCGYNFQCPHCAVALKSHLAENLVKCHYCDYSQKAIPLCPQCRGSRILNFGTGTQKLESELIGFFPGARVCRMDSDTTSRKGAQEKILSRMEQREIDILVGTQMIAKGHDFPDITLVGVISADTSLNMPDFRAAEKTFQLLTQVAGRGGRGDQAGRVIIQTFNPDHYTLRHARNHDYISFYEEELNYRRTLSYPPFSRLIMLRLSSAKPDALSTTARELGKEAKTISSRYKSGLEIIGPADSPLAKIRGEHRMQMLIKGQNSAVLHRIASELAEQHATSTVKITIDVDPENFM